MVRFVTSLTGIIILYRRKQLTYYLMNSVNPCMLLHACRQKHRVCIHWCVGVRSDMLSFLVTTQWYKLIGNESHFTLLIFICTCCYYTSQLNQPLQPNLWINQGCIMSCCVSQWNMRADFSLNVVWNNLPWLCRRCCIGNVCTHAVKYVNYSLLKGWNYHKKTNKKTTRNVVCIKPWGPSCTALCFFTMKNSPMFYKN